MSAPRLLAVALLGIALLAAPHAAAATGPYAGVVKQGETRTHQYDNNPTNNPCIEMVTTYTVTLAFAPAGDALTLSAAGRSVTATGGAASITFQAGVCTAFTISVTGTDVEDAAAYAVVVTGGVLGGAGGIVAWG